MPCDVGDCPYPLSPGGEGALHPDNELAVHLWGRLRALGPVALELSALSLSPLEADFVAEQLYTLETHHQRLSQEEG